MTMPSSREKTGEPQTKPQRYGTAVRDGNALVFKQQTWKDRRDLVMLLSRKTFGVRKADSTPNSAVISKLLSTSAPKGLIPVSVLVT